MSYFRRGLIALAAVPLTLAGCSDRSIDAPTASSTAQPPTGVDSTLQYTNRWIPNPVLDLMSPEGTFVRAANESLDRAGYGEGLGMEAIENAGYAGFSKAFNNAIDPEIVGGNARKDRPIVGTMYYEVVRFERDGDRFTAGVCTYGSATATKVWNGYQSSGRSKPATSALIFSFGPDPALPPERQSLPAASQRGPANVPSTNVFGTWLMTSIKILGANVDLPQCANKLAPSTPPDVPEDYYVSPNPPPALPPDPGWPQPGSA